jgi:hypothetical protein
VGANSLQTSINFLQAALSFWVPTVGTNSEPALTAANVTQQVMTSPPFRFPWNRNTFNLTLTGGMQDYTQSVTDFGYLELATGQYPSAGKTFPIAVKNTTPLGETVDQQQPAMVSVMQNTVGTSIKLRFLGVPDKAYTVTCWYQKFVPLMTDPTSFWTPPDYCSYIYNRGLLAHLYEAKGDMRAQQEKVAFAAALISASEGLTDTEINVFLAQYLANPRTLESLQYKTQQGVQARGSG